MYHPNLNRLDSIHNYFRYYRFQVVIIHCCSKFVINEPMSLPVATHQRATDRSHPKSSLNWELLFSSDLLLFIQAPSTFRHKHWWHLLKEGIVCYGSFLEFNPYDSPNPYLTSFAFSEFYHSYYCILLTSWRLHSGSISLLPSSILIKTVTQ